MKKKKIKISRSKNKISGKKIPQKPQEPIGEDKRTPQPIERDPTTPYPIAPTPE